MDSNELWQQYDMDYHEQLLFLKKKYGLPQGNYFLTESCKSTNGKITRAKEGLFIHHDYEWNPDDFGCHALSDSEIAREKSYDFQLSANLTYCNLIEHLMLHIKIHKLRYDVFNCNEIDGVEKFLIPQLNDMYKTKKYKKEWLVATKAQIETNYEDFRKLVHLYSEISDIEPEILFTLTLRNH